MRVHAIVTSYGPDSVGVSSPQVPALFAGGTSRDEYSPEHLVHLLDAAGVPEEYRLVVHHQTYEVRDEREWFVRVLVDPFPESYQKRQVTLRRLRDLLQTTPAPIDMAVTSVTGEALFIIATPDDTVGWLLEQMDANGGVATVVVADGAGLWMSDLVMAHPHDGQAVLDPTTTMRDLLGRVDVVADAATYDFLTGGQAPTVRRSREPVAV